MGPSKRMKRYIATFFSHFGALTYYKALEEQGIAAKIMPVPRKISSSCGTCVSYEHGSVFYLEECELDAVYLEVCDALECAFKA